MSNDEKPVTEKPAIIIPKNRKYVFICGMPRAGSTVLSALLAQNPRHFTTSTSPVIEVIVNMRNNWFASPTTRAAPHDDEDTMITTMMRGAFDGAYATDKPVIFEKSRGWCFQPEMAEMLTVDKERTENKEVYFLVCVRDLREILASFERKFRQSIDTRTPLNKATTIERIEDNMKMDGLVGGPLAAVRECVVRGYRKHMLIIDHKKICEHPRRVMDAIYRFIDEKPFDHNFENIVNVNPEDDLIWGFKNLHRIESKIKEVPETWQRVFSGPLLETELWKYVMKEQEFWKSFPEGESA